MLGNSSKMLNKLTNKTSLISLLSSIPNLSTLFCKSQDHSTKKLLLVFQSQLPFSLNLETFCKLLNFRQRALFCKRRLQDQTILRLPTVIRTWLCITILAPTLQRPLNICLSLCKFLRSSVAINIQISHLSTSTLVSCTRTVKGIRQQLIVLVRACI